jgi:glyoxylase-like metal-dependent hydrolase (beta-lactamase superfamily II)
VLTPWHERDTRRLIERFEPPVYTPLPETAEYLMESYGITAEEAGVGPDVVRLLKEGIGQARPYATGDRLDVGLVAFAGHRPNDMVLWVKRQRAVVAGDTLVDFGNGLEINARWLELQRVTREQIAQRLRPLLELPVAHVLATHSGPYDGAVLKHALF